jgi:hypothetical protein
MSLTMAFFISMLVVLWFFGMTLFGNMQLQSGKETTFLGQVISGWSYRAYVDGELVDSTFFIDRYRAQIRCGELLIAHPHAQVRCLWGGVEF